MHNKKMRAASRTDPPAPTDTEMMTISLSDKPPGASVGGRGVFVGSASVGGRGVLVGGFMLLSLVDCEASEGSGVCCRISEVIPLPLPKSIAVELSSICEVAVGVGMVGWEEDWGASGEVGMVGWEEDWGDGGEVGMVGWEEDWGDGGEVGMVGWEEDWGDGGEVGMVGWEEDWGDGGRGEVGRGESGRCDASGEGVSVGFCAQASEGRVLNATAASSRAGNIWLW